MDECSIQEMHAPPAQTLIICISYYAPDDVEMYITDSAEYLAQEFDDDAEIYNWCGDYAEKVEQPVSFTGTVVTITWE